MSTEIGSSGISSTGSAQNKQQLVFQRFYGYWRSRTLFKVQTPWAVFDNCAIKSLRAIQDAETNTITDFEVSFKVIRVATNKILAASGNNRFASASKPTVDQGQSTPSISKDLVTSLNGAGL